MVVDDNARIAELARRALATDGHRVTLAYSAAAARALAVRDQFLLLLTDFAMPSGDGLELVRSFRRLQPQARCVLWSAALPSSVADEARRLGATVAPKLVGDDLRALVNAALAQTPARAAVTPAPAPARSQM